jgi:hypothetical protein
MTMLEAMLIGACVGIIAFCVYSFLDAAPWTWASDARYVAELQQIDYDMRQQWNRKKAGKPSLQRFDQEFMQTFNLTENQYQLMLKIQRKELRR